jgi:hypothetical protein
MSEADSLDFVEKWVEFDQHDPSTGIDQQFSRAAEFEGLNTIHGFTGSRTCLISSAIGYRLQLRKWGELRDLGEG